jgi:hypothetical protein
MMDTTVLSLDRLQALKSALDEDPAGRQPGE